MISFNILYTGLYYLNYIILFFFADIKLIILYWYLFEHISSLEQFIKLINR